MGGAAVLRSAIALVQLEALEEGANFGVGPVGVADDLAANDAGAVDDVSLGPSIGVIELGGCLTGIADGGEIDVEASEETHISVGIFVDADGENGEVGTLMVKFNECGSLLNARAAPTGPEVEQDDLSPIVGQVDGVNAVSHGEVGCNLADLRRLGAAIATREGKQRQSRQRQQAWERKQSGGPHIPIILSGRL
jgi:hypothetical protein